MSVSCMRSTTSLEWGVVVGVSMSLRLGLDGLMVSLYLC